MKTIQVTQHELNQATRPNVYRNKKKYTRKVKHSGNSEIKDWFVYCGIIKIRKNKGYEKKRFKINEFFGNARNGLWNCFYTIPPLSR